MPTYRIADLVVRMTCGGRTAKQAQPYLITEDLTPDVEISITPEQIEKAKPMNPTLSDDEWEYILSATAFYRALIRHDGLMLHASAILYQDRAYLFSAPSGTGKSTHTKLWQKEFGKENVLILNDDKPAIRRIGERFLAFGTPWSGKYDISIPVGVPIQSICFLERAEENTIERLSTRESLTNLISQTLHRLSDDDLDLLFDMLSLLLKEIPVFRLKCNISPDAAHLAERAMSGGSRRKLPQDPETRRYFVRDGYTLRIRAGSNVIVCLDDDRFIGLTTLNESGVLLFRLLENGAYFSNLTAALQNEYGIRKELANADILRFLTRLTELDIIGAE